MQRALAHDRLPLRVGLVGVVGLTLGFWALAPAAGAVTAAPAAPPGPAEAAPEESTIVPAPPPSGPPAGANQGNGPYIPPPPQQAQGQYQGYPSGYGNYPSYPQGHNYNGYPGYQARASHGVYRPFSLTFGAGPGALIGPGEHDMALSYSLFRLGFGVTDNVSFMISYEGAGTSSVNPATDNDSWLSQHIWSVGFQYHFVPRMYVRLGMGLGEVEEDIQDGGPPLSGGRGTSFLAALGLEIIQGPHMALGLEANGTTTKYARESWQTAGLNLTLAIF